MTGISLVILCIAIGICAQWSARFPKSTAQVLNAFVICVSLPALVYVQIRTLALSHPGFATLLLPASMAWIQFALAGLLFFLFRYSFKFTRETAGALLLTVGLGNTSFVGFPLLEAIFGPDAIRTGVLVDQPGSFLVLSTLGVAAVSALGRGSHSSRDFLLRVFKFPPFVALLLAWATAPLSVPEILTTTLERLAGTLVPVALVAVGYQLKLDARLIRARLSPLAVGLTAKLLLMPLVMSVLYLHVFPRQERISEIIVIESAMAPMITAGILASESDLDPELASLMVGVGILLSLITVPLWARALGIA